MRLFRGWEITFGKVISLSVDEKYNLSKELFSKEIPSFPCIDWRTPIQVQNAQKRDLSSWKMIDNWSWWAIIWFTYIVNFCHSWVTVMLLFLLIIAYVYSNKTNFDELIGFAHLHIMYCKTWYIMVIIMSTL